MIALISYRLIIPNLYLVNSKISATIYITYIQEAIMAKKSGLKPGGKAPASGQYAIKGPKGGKGKEVTSEKGNSLPPTEKKGSTYTLVDPTRNKSANA